MAFSEHILDNLDALVETTLEKREGYSPTYGFTKVAIASSDPPIFAGDIARRGRARTVTNLISAQTGSELLLNDLAAPMPVHCPIQLLRFSLVTSSSLCRRFSHCWRPTIASSAATLRCGYVGTRDKEAVAGIAEYVSKYEASKKAMALQKCEAAP